MKNAAAWEDSPSLRGGNFEPGRFLDQVTRTLVVCGPILHRVDGFVSIRQDTGRNAGGGENRPAESDSEVNHHLARLALPGTGTRATG